MAKSNIMASMMPRTVVYGDTSPETGPSPLITGPSQSDSNHLEEARIASHYFVNPEDSFLIPETSAFSGQPFAFPSKDEVTHAATKASIAMTTAGHAASSTKGMDPLWQKILPGGRVIPAALHRGLYDLSHTDRAAIGAFTTHPSAFKSPMARFFSNVSQVLNTGAFVSGVFMLASFGLRKYRGALGTAARLFSETSFGFNKTGALLALGSGAATAATAIESKHEQKETGSALQERIKGLSEEDAKAIVKKHVPHYTNGEIATRELGTGFSFGGSFTGALAAVVRSSPLSRALFIASGGLFFLGLAVPALGNGNTPEERQFASDETDLLFKQMKEAGKSSVLPAVGLTAGAWLCGKFFPGLKESCVLQVFDPGKADNTFNLYALLQHLNFGASPLAIREVYEKDPRIGILRETAEQVRNITDISTLPETSYARRIMEEGYRKAAESKGRAAVMSV